MDSINYLGWESNISIRPPKFFKILPTKFQWAQVIDKDIVDRPAYSMILGHNTKFLVKYLCVARSNLRHK